MKQEQLLKKSKKIPKKKSNLSSESDEKNSNSDNVTSGLGLPIELERELRHLRELTQILLGNRGKILDAEIIIAPPFNQFIDNSAHANSSSSSNDHHRVLALSLSHSVLLLVDAHSLMNTINSFNPNSNTALKYDVLPMKIIHFEQTVYPLNGLVATSFSTRLSPSPLSLLLMYPGEGSKHSIYIYDVSFRKIVYEIIKHDDKILSCCEIILDKEHYFATSSLDYKILIWPTVILRRTLMERRGYIKKMDSKNNKRDLISEDIAAAAAAMATGGKSNEEKAIPELNENSTILSNFVSTPESRLLRPSDVEHHSLTGHTHCITNLKYSSWQELLIGSGFDYTIYAWSCNNFQLVRKFSGHIKNISGIYLLLHYDNFFLRQQLRYMQYEDMIEQQKSMTSFDLYPHRPKNFFNNQSSNENSKFDKSYFEEKLISIDETGILKCWTLRQEGGIYGEQEFSLTLPISKQSLIKDFCIMTSSLNINPTNSSGISSNSKSNEATNLLESLNQRLCLLTDRLQFFTMESPTNNISTIFNSMSSNSSSLSAATSASIDEDFKVLPTGGLCISPLSDKFVINFPTSFQNLFFHLSDLNSGKRISLIDYELIASSDKINITSSNSKGDIVSEKKTNFISSNDQACCADNDIKGKKIFIGTREGHVLLYETATCSLLRVLTIEQDSNNSSGNGPPTNNFDSKYYRGSVARILYVPRDELVIAIYEFGAIKILNGCFRGGYDHTKKTNSSSTTNPNVVDLSDDPELKSKLNFSTDHPFHHHMGGRTPAKPYLLREIDIRWATPSSSEGKKVSNAAFSPEFNTIAVLTYEGKVFLYDYLTLDLLSCIDSSINHHADDEMEANNIGNMFSGFFKEEDDENDESFITEEKSSKKNSNELAPIFTTISFIPHLPLFIVGSSQQIIDIWSTKVMGFRYVASYKLSSSHYYNFDNLTAYKKAYEAHFKNKVRSTPCETPLSTSGTVSGTPKNSTPTLSSTRGSFFSSSFSDNESKTTSLYNNYLSLLKDSYRKLKIFNDHNVYNLLDIEFNEDFKSNNNSNGSDKFLNNSELEKNYFGALFTNMDTFIGRCANSNLYNNPIFNLLTFNVNKFSTPTVIKSFFIKNSNFNVYKSKKNIPNLDENENKKDSDIGINSLISRTIQEIKSSYQTYLEKIQDDEYNTNTPSSNLDTLSSINDTDYLDFTSNERSDLSSLYKMGGWILFIGLSSGQVLSLDVTQAIIKSGALEHIIFIQNPQHVYLQRPTRIYTPFQHDNEYSHSSNSLLGLKLPPEWLKILQEPINRSSMQNAIFEVASLFSNKAKMKSLISPMNRRSSQFKKMNKNLLRFSHRVLRERKTTFKPLYGFNACPCEPIRDFDFLQTNLNFLYLNLTGVRVQNHKKNELTNFNPYFQPYYFDNYSQQDRYPRDSIFKSAWGPELLNEQIKENDKKIENKINKSNNKDELQKKLILPIFVSLSDCGIVGMWGLHGVFIGQSLSKNKTDNVFSINNLNILTESDYKTQANLTSVNMNSSQSSTTKELPVFYRDQLTTKESEVEAAVARAKQAFSSSGSSALISNSFRNSKSNFRKSMNSSFKQSSLSIPLLSNFNESNQISFKNLFESFWKSQNKLIIYPFDSHPLILHPKSVFENPNFKFNKETMTNILPKSHTWESKLSHIWLRLPPSITAKNDLNSSIPLFSGFNNRIENNSNNSSPPHHFYMSLIKYSYLRATINNFFPKLVDDWRNFLINSDTPSIDTNSATLNTTQHFQVATSSLALSTTSIHSPLKSKNFSSTNELDKDIINMMNQNIERKFEHQKFVPLISHILSSTSETSFSSQLKYSSSEIESLNNSNYFPNYEKEKIRRGEIKIKEDSLKQFSSTLKKNAEALEQMSPKKNDANTNEHIQTINSNVPELINSDSEANIIKLELKLDDENNDVDVQKLKFMKDDDPIKPMNKIETIHNLRSQRPDSAPNRIPIYNRPTSASASRSKVILKGSPDKDLSQNRRPMSASAIRNKKNQSQLLSNSASSSILSPPPSNLFSSPQKIRPSSASVLNKNSSPIIFQDRNNNLNSDVRPQSAPNTILPREVKQIDNIIELLNDASVKTPLKKRNSELNLDSFSNLSLPTASDSFLDACSTCEINTLLGKSLTHNNSDRLNELQKKVDSVLSLNSTSSHLPSAIASSPFLLNKTRPKSAPSRSDKPSNGQEVQDYYISSNWKLDDVIDIEKENERIESRKLQTNPSSYSSKENNDSLYGPYSNNDIARFFHFLVVSKTVEKIKKEKEKKLATFLSTKVSGNSNVNSVDNSRPNSFVTTTGPYSSSPQFNEPEEFLADKLNRSPLFFNDPNINSSVIYNDRGKECTKLFDGQPHFHLLTLINCAEMLMCNPALNSIPSNFSNSFPSVSHLFTREDEELITSYHKELDELKISLLQQQQQLEIQQHKLTSKSRSRNINNNNEMTITMVLNKQDVIKSQLNMINKKVNNFYLPVFNDFLALNESTENSLPLTSSNSKLTRENTFSLLPVKEPIIKINNYKFPDLNFECLYSNLSAIESECDFIGGHIDDAINLLVQDGSVSSSTSNSNDNLANNSNSITIKLNNIVQTINLISNGSCIYNLNSPASFASSNNISSAFSSSPQSNIPNNIYNSSFKSNSNTKKSLEFINLHPFVNNLRQYKQKLILNLLKHESEELLNNGLASNTNQTSSRASRLYNSKQKVQKMLETSYISLFKVVELAFEASREYQVQVRLTFLFWLALDLLGLLKQAERIEDILQNNNSNNDDEKEDEFKTSIQLNSPGKLSTRLRTTIKNTTNIVSEIKNRTAIASSFVEKMDPDKYDCIYFKISKNESNNNSNSIDQSIETIDDYILIFNYSQLAKIIKDIPLLTPDPQKGFYHWVIRRKVIHIYVLMFIISLF